MKRKLKTQVRFHIPCIQEVEVKRRFDREWKTHFVTISNTELSWTETKRPIYEELIICINNREEADQFIQLVTKALEKIK